MVDSLLKRSYSEIGIESILIQELETSKGAFVAVRKVAVLTPALSPVPTPTVDPAPNPAPAPTPTPTPTADLDLAPLLAASYFFVRYACLMIMFCFFLHCAPTFAAENSAAPGKESAAAAKQPTAAAAKQPTAAAAKQPTAAGPSYSQKLDVLKKTTVFIFPGGNSMREDSEERVIGTGFLLTIPCLKNGQKASLSFLVSCKHVLMNQDRVRLRFNSQKANMTGSLIIDLRSAGQNKNIFAAATPRVDLAAVHIPALPLTADAFVVDAAQILDESAWEKKQIGEGSMLLSIAPAYGYPGYSRNLPAVRFGRIALVSMENWFNERDPTIYERAFLVDIGLNHGSSGSPLFLFPDRRLYKEESTQKAPYLMGVVKGASDVPSGRDLQTNSKVEIPQTLTAFEPPSSLISFVKQLLREMAASGYKPLP